MIYHEFLPKVVQASGALSSRHAVRVLDIDYTEDGTPFIVMELLSGRDLSRIVERDGPQPVARSVRWVIQACDAIAHARRGKSKNRGRGDLPVTAGGPTLASLPTPALSERNYLHSGSASAVLPDRDFAARCFEFGRGIGREMKV